MNIRSFYFVNLDRSHTIVVKTRLMEKVMRLKPKKRVLICSCHKTYCDALSQAIVYNSDRYQIVSKQYEIGEAIKILDVTTIDFILLNIDNHLKQPFEYIRSFKMRYPQVKLIIMTFWDEPNFHKRMINAGAFAFYVTNWKVEKLLQNMEEKNNTTRNNVTNICHTGGITDKRSSQKLGNKYLV